MLTIILFYLICEEIMLNVVNLCKDVSILAMSINHLAQQLTKTRTSLWCASQIASLIESRLHCQQQVVAAAATPSSSTSISIPSVIVNTNWFDTHLKTREFARSNFKIKSDLVATPAATHTD